MTSKSTSVHLKVLNSTGSQVATECVAAIRLSDVHFRLEQTPAMVLGVARDDVIEMVNPRTGDFNVVKRGGLLAVQVFCKGTQDSLRHRLMEVAEQYGGHFESYDERKANGGTVCVITLSLPVTLGFPQIETVLDDIVGNVEGAEWYFGNVYNPDDGVTPLNWWVN